MTRKEALAVLHRFRDAVGWHLYSEQATEEEKRLREQVLAAFTTLNEAIHGRHLYRQRSEGLCTYCYLCLSLPDLLIQAKGHGYTAPCCKRCLRRLQKEQCIERVEQWDRTAMSWREMASPLELGNVVPGLQPV